MTGPGRQESREKAGFRPVGACILAIALGWVRAASSDDGRQAWPVGRPVPIAVDRGVASFVAPSGSATGRTLVVVSSLSRVPGAYAIRTSCRPANQAMAPTLADDGPIRVPKAVAPNIPRAVAPASADPPKHRTFHLPVRDGDPSSPSNYARIIGELRGFGGRVQVYVDVNDQGRVSDASVREVVATMEQAILPRADARLGTPRDVDGDGRFAVLFSGWLGHLADGKLAVDGFVRGSDFDGQSPPFGNRCDMMALNASLAPGPHARTVMAHEYRHAITYCRKALGPAGADEEGWLDEALAHLAEDEHGFSRSNLDYRVNASLAAPERYRLLVGDYAASDLIRSHGHRGSAYRFLRWCADVQGPGLADSLILSPSRGVPNLEAATGRGFEALYRGWSVATFADALGDGEAPRFSRLAIGDADLATLDGTTSHYVIVDGSATGAVAVNVTAPPEANLQITAIRLPEDLARMDLDARVTASADGPRLTLRFQERDGREIRLESIRWSSSIPSSDPTERAERSGSLGGEALTQAMGTASLSPWGRITSHPIPIGRGPDPLIVTAAGRDPHGRRVVAWAEAARAE